MLACRRMNVSPRVIAEPRIGVDDTAEIECGNIGLFFRKLIYLPGGKCLRTGAGEETDR